MNIFSEFQNPANPITIDHKLTQREMIYCLSRRIEELLSELLRHTRTVALLDFPNHSNVGDSAVWAGQKMLLRRLGISIPYVSDISMFSHSELSMRLPAGGTILISGGGNLGDMWPHHESFRERIISTYTHYKVIQLAQSIHFRDMENLKRAKKIFNRHPDLTLLVRDSKSLEIARNEFRAPSFLCPDMSFALGPLRIAADEPVWTLSWLRRKDRESCAYNVPKTSVIPEMDWMGEDLTWAMEMNRFLRQRMLNHAHSLKKDFYLIAKTYDCMARDRLVRGCRLLMKSRRIMTDRLHGHILSLLLGIPHICLDNSNGKIRNFYETWTRECELVSWADSPEEAYDTSAGPLGEDIAEEDIACSA